MSITQERITQEDIQEAEQKEMDINVIMRLVDLMFLFKDETKDIPS